MDFYSSFKIIIGLLITTSLMIGLAYLSKKLDLFKKKLIKQSDSRIKLIENHYLDNNRRLVIINVDNKEHLILLSNNGDIVIEGFANNVKNNI